MGELSINGHAARNIVAVRQQLFLTEGIVSKRGLTITEAAEYCGISPSTYRSWMDDGRVPGYWPNTRRIDRFELETALDKMSGREPRATNVSRFEAWKATENAKA